MQQRAGERPPQAANAVPRWHLHRRLYDWVLHWAHTPYGTPALAVLAFSESSFFPIPPDPLLMALALARPRRSFYYALVCSVASVVGGLFGYLIGFALWDPVGAPLLRSLHQLGPQHTRVVVQSVEGNQVVVKEPDGDSLRVHRMQLHVAKPTGSPPVGEMAYETEQTSAPLAVGQEVFMLTDNYHVARARYDEYGEWIVFTAAFSPIPYKVFTILSGLAQLSLVKFTIASVVGRSGRFFLVGALIFAFGEPIRRFIERYFNLLCLVFVILLVGCAILIKYL